MEKHEKDAILEQMMIDYGDELVRLAYTYVKNQETAKDIVQNTFVKSYEKLETFRHESKIRTWLYRITINECKDYLKSWHHKKVQTRNFINEAARSFLLSTEEQIIQDETNYCIMEKILALSSIYRDVIFLYYFKNLKVDEVAEMTGLQPNTVKSRLRRGKQKLKTMIEEAEAYG